MQNMTRYAAIVHPDFYAPRNGIPLHWTLIDRLVLDVQGEYPPPMAEVVTRFMRHWADRRIELNRVDFECILAYLMHWVMAPIWRAAGCDEMIDELAVSLSQVETMTELDEWLMVAMVKGFDPFSPPSDAEIAEIRGAVFAPTTS